MTTDHKLIVRINGPEKEIYSLITKIPEVEKITSLGEREEGVFEFSIETKENADIRRELFFRLADRQWPILTMKNNELTLEDIFLKLTKDDKAKKISGGAKK